MTDFSTLHRRKQALIIGSGIGGLSLGIRLQSLGFDTTILEKLDGPGGRAYQKRTPDGYVFDMGPTVITVPHFIEELFALERDGGWFGQPDYPPHVLTGERVRVGESGGPRTREYVRLVPILPFYRIAF
ncbi:MAG: NAD(P)-binding protein, partial [Deinococcota bacterium]